MHFHEITKIMLSSSFIRDNLHAFYAQTTTIFNAKRFVGFPPRSEKKTTTLYVVCISISLENFVLLCLYINLDMMNLETIGPVYTYRSGTGARIYMRLYMILAMRVRGKRYGNLINIIMMQQKMYIWVSKLVRSSIRWPRPRPCRKSQKWFYINFS